MADAKTEIVMTCEARHEWRVSADTGPTEITDCPQCGRVAKFVKAAFTTDGALTVRVAK